jgi:hypothetical protein
MHGFNFKRYFGPTLLCTLLLSAGLNAQDDVTQPAAEEAGPPVIADEPKTVDPAGHVPPKLAKAVSVEFDESSLRDVAEWIQQEQKLPVLFDNKALSEEGLLLSDPVSDRLNDEPLYLLLNRLRSLGLAWYVQDDVLYITTVNVADSRMSTRPYNLGDLLDAGYSRSSITETVLQAIEGPWEASEGEGGGAEWLGDVFFVRQTDQRHRELRGFFAAIKNHGAQTFTFDPPQHVVLRQKLNQNVSANFARVPLVGAVQELAEQAAADIRLDLSALRAEGVREREPVSLILADRTLRTTLDVLLSDLSQTWILRDGVIWITSASEAAGQRKTAIYDVRDLCRDNDESEQLKITILKQTSSAWEENSGDGGAIVFAKAGTMVVQQTERGLNEVGKLLATYRKALHESKRRDRDAVDQKEVKTRYYRLDANIAENLVSALPQLVQPETWQTKAPEAVGTIVMLNSQPDILDSHGHVLHDSGSGGQAKANAFVAARSVLIIRQTREVHVEIAEVIMRIKNGDPEETEFIPGGMGGFGGGIGGGFFPTK